ncbi:hypothetical protein OS493_032094 [Desmophyllum pertusum]|uniref:Fibronectin type-III domain-containing protein n=1 Tax=Desmophyllum pertusum TaxID=174260 RepID=A0A9W9YJF1_9CNID|nr:hypothetical protein OS493_032094 [Desmophyllum pertusum]
MAMYPASLRKVSRLKDLNPQKTIKVTWSPVPQGHVRGLLVGYSIKYRRIETTEREVFYTEQHIATAKPTEYMISLKVSIVLDLRDSSGSVYSERHGTIGQVNRQQAACSAPSWEFESTMHTVYHDAFPQTWHHAVTAPQNFSGDFNLGSDVDVLVFGDLSLIEGQNDAALISDESSNLRSTSPELTIEENAPASLASPISEINSQGSESWRRFPQDLCRMATLKHMLIMSRDQ